MYLKKILSLLLCLVLCLSSLALFACDSSSHEGDSEHNEQSIEKKYVLIENNQTNYEIIVPSVCNYAEYNAAENLSIELTNSTGVKLNVAYENAKTDGKKYISIGETELYKNSVFFVDRNELNVDGFVIKTVDENIYLVGGYSEKSHLYAVYSLLNELINFEAYSFDEVYSDTCETVKFGDMNLVEVPDYAYRHIYSDTIGRCDDPVKYRDLLRIKPPLLLGGAHTIISLLPPEKYLATHPEWYGSTDATRGYVCFSNEELVAELSKVVIERAQTAPKEGSYIMVTQMDGSMWCTCEKCQASLNKYGTNSAVLIKALNKVADSLRTYLAENEPDKKIKIGTFAYTTTSRAPVKTNENGEYVPYDESVKLDPLVSVRMAPIALDYSVNIKDPLNASMYDDMLTWQNVTDELLVWNYGTNFSYYFVPFCNWNVLKDNVKIFKELNVNYLMDQFDKKQCGFMALRNYVLTKLYWDNDADYEKLIKDFFVNYYQDGASAMYKFYDEYRQWFNIIRNEYSSTINGDIYCKFGEVENVFPLNLAEKWEGYFQEAKASIEYLKDIDYNYYTKLYERIDLESIFVDSVRLFWYSSSYSSTQLYDMRVAFKEKCDKHGLTHYSETQTLSSIYEGWGI